MNGVFAPAALITLLASAGSSFAEESANTPGSAPAAAPAQNTRELTPEEKEEKEARKACKKTIYILATRDPNGRDACDITKT